MAQALGINPNEFTIDYDSDTLAIGFHLPRFKETEENLEEESFFTEEEYDFPQI